MTGSVSKPAVAVTCGDPNGIGPDIIVAWLAAGEPACCRPLLVGCPSVLEENAERIGFSLDQTDLVPAGGTPAEPLRRGEIQAEAGRLAHAALVEAHRLVASGRADAMVTAPWSKEALQLAGLGGTGHTEVLASLTGCPDPLTLFVSGPVLCAFFTRHIPLAAVAAEIRSEKIAFFLEGLQKELIRIGRPAPCIAVAALNPHAGEGGLLGREEIEEIAPALQTARSRGIDAVGPVPADAIFHAAFEGRYDCVVSLYHDQGHTALKTRDFFGTVSLTLGLPYIRTSPDHGTAFDMVGSGNANPASLIKAVELAASLVEVYKDSSSQSPSDPG